MDGVSKCGLMCALTFFKFTPCAAWNFSCPHISSPIGIYCLSALQCIDGWHRRWSDLWSLTKWKERNVGTKKDGGGVWLSSSMFSFKYPHIVRDAYACLLFVTVTRKSMAAETSPLCECNALRIVTEWKWASMKLKPPAVLISSHPTSHSCKTASSICGKIALRVSITHNQMCSCTRITLYSMWWWVMSKCASTGLYVTPFYILVLTWLSSGNNK